MNWRSLFSGSKKADSDSSEDEEAQEEQEEAPAPPAAPALTAIFGKLPARRDFVRLGSAGVPAFERWLEQGLETATSRGGAIPTGVLSFYLPALPMTSGPARGAAEGCDFLGVMVPSRDLVGRECPLALLRSSPGGPADMLHEVWQSTGIFRDSAQGLLAEAAKLDEAALAVALTELGALQEKPDSSSAELLNSPAVATLEGILGPRIAGGPAHAIVTLVAACEAARAGARSDGPSITVEAPVRDEATVAFWLALCGRLLRWPSARPSLVIGDDRLVLGLSAGAAQPGVLAAHCLGQKAGSRYWPLASRDAALRAKSLARLPAAVQELLGRSDGKSDATLAALIDAVAGPVAASPGGGTVPPPSRGHS